MKRPDLEPVPPSVGLGEQTSLSTSKRRILTSPLRKGVAQQHPHILRQHRKERLLVKRALGIKARTTVNGSIRQDLRVLPKRKCDKDRKYRTTRKWVSEPAAEETRRIKMTCSTPGVAAVFQRLEEEKLERSRFVSFGSAASGSSTTTATVPNVPPRNQENNSLESMAAAFPQSQPASSLAVNSPASGPIAGQLSHVKRGLEHDRKRKTEEFKRVARLSKFSHRISTFVSTPKVFHDKIWWHAGDIVSARGENGLTYYAQTRGFLCDQYGEKSCVLTWLVPKKPCRSSPSPFNEFNERERNEFVPSKFVIGYDEDFPRKLECLRWVCRAPSDYFRAVDAPYATQPLSYSRKSGFVWTRLGPVETRLEEIEHAKVENTFVKHLETSVGDWCHDGTPARVEQRSSSEAVIRDRVAELLRWKSQQLKSQSAQAATKTPLEFRDVAFIPAGPHSSEEMCVMMRRTFDALVERRTEESSASLEAQLRTLLQREAADARTGAEESESAKSPERDRHWSYCSETLLQTSDDFDEAIGDGEQGRKCEQAHSREPGDVDEPESGIEEDRSGDGFPATVATDSQKCGEYLSYPPYLADHNYGKPIMVRVSSVSGTT